MEIINKYKYFIVAGAIICTIIGIIVYNQAENSTKEEYSELENFTSEYIEVKKEKIKVHVSGEVMEPGVIEIEDGARIIDAVNMAGGLTEEADIRNINLAYILEDAMKINIPNINDEQVDVISEMDMSENKVMVNINTANAEELQKLDGIGASIALKIISYRKEHGKFSSIEELKNVSGIGDNKYNGIKNNIYVK